MNKLYILLISIVGEIIKFFYRIRIPHLSETIKYKSDCEERVIVSLTSYGRRVGSVLPFALYSLLRQTYKPNMIVLWLDNNNWSPENLPKKLKELEKAGLLVVNYCTDIRSYKKLVPSLQAFPNDIIITVDDDLFYRRDLIERLVKAHIQYPQCVITHRAHGIIIRDGNIAPYNEWDDTISDSNDENVFPTGGAGCLYKKSMLYKDVTNDELFMKLCPLADDVWFFFMEILQGTKRIVLQRKGYVYIPLDNFYQFFHRHSNLSSRNCHENQNDLQIANMIDYYNLKVDENEFIVK